MQYIKILCLINLMIFSSCNNNTLLDKKYVDVDFCEILPIINKSCIKCHSNDGLAPFNLTSVEMFSRKKLTILHVLENDIMPPWKPNSQYSQFKNDYGLTIEEKKMLYNWVINNFRNSGNCEFYFDVNNSISYSNVGECFDFNDLYRINSNQDYFKCFLFKNPFDEDVYMKAIDILPGNISAVHHVSVFMSENISVIEDCIESKLDLCSCDYDDYKQYKLVSAWTKGSVPYHLQDGYGYFIPKNSYFAIQVHYSAGFIGQLDSSKVCFTRLDEPLQKEVVFAFHDNFEIEFLPNEVKYDTLIIENDKNIKILSVWPHTHNLAKEVKCYAKTNAGDEIPLIHIPNWDYLWQSAYVFETPPVIPRNSKIYMVVKFDNTSKNSRNPFNPPQTIRFGQSSKDEMLNFSYTYVEM